MTLARRLSAEAVGTAFLLVAIVGSGVMAERLSEGNYAVALLANSTTTGAMLIVLVGIFGPVSGGHLNPAVTAVFAMRGEITLRLAGAYILSQVVGALIGTWFAHLMFGLPVLQLSAKSQVTPALWFSEAMATFGLILTILGTLRWKKELIPFTVGLYIASAIWFTSSDSFANPDATIGRSLTNTFTGLNPASIPAFLIAQLAGAALAAIFCGWLLAIDENE